MGVSIGVKTKSAAEVPLRWAFIWSVPMELAVLTAGSVQSYSIVPSLPE